jgi:hypothetical protein
LFLAVGDQVACVVVGVADGSGRTLYETECTVGSSSRVIYARQAIGVVGIVSVGQVVDLGIGRASGQAIALVLGDVAVEVVVDERLSVAVVDGRCTRGALPEGGAAQAIGSIVGEIVALDVAANAL